MLIQKLLWLSLSACTHCSPCPTPPGPAHSGRLSVKRAGPHQATGKLCEQTRHLAVAPQPVNQPNQRFFHGACPGLRLAPQSHEPDTSHPLYSLRNTPGSFWRRVMQPMGDGSHRCPGKPRTALLTGVCPPPSAESSLPADVEAARPSLQPPRRLPRRAGRTVGTAEAVTHLALLSTKESLTMTTGPSSGHSESWY